MTAIFYNNLAE